MVKNEGILLSTINPMNAEKENLSAQESLDLIASMIVQAKGNVTRNIFYFLLWGWTIVIANLGVFYLINYTGVKDPFIMFAITIPAAIASVIYGMMNSKGERAHTLIDTVNMWMWIGFAISCFTISILGTKINFQTNAVILVMSSTPTFVTGLMLRFRPLAIGGIILWVLGVVTFLLPREHQFLVAAIAITLGYLVPAYMLKYSRK
jgi:hypothetical protein